MRGRYVISDEINIWRILFLIVVESAVNKLYSGACSEIGAADTDDYKDIAGAFYLLCRRLYVLDIRLVISNGEVKPAEKIISRPRAPGKRFRRANRLFLDGAELVCAEYASEIFVRKSDCHFYYLFLKKIHFTFK